MYFLDQDCTSVVCLDILITSKIFSSLELIRLKHLLQKSQYHSDQLKGRQVQHRVEHRAVVGHKREDSLLLTLDIPSVQHPSVSKKEEGHLKNNSPDLFQTGSSRKIMLMEKLLDWLWKKVIQSDVAVCKRNYPHRLILLKIYIAWD